MARIASSGRGIFLWADLPEGMDTIGIFDFVFRKKKLTKTNVKELLEGKETLVKGIKNKEKKPYNAVVKIGEKGYIDFISFSK